MRPQYLLLLLLLALASCQRGSGSDIGPILLPLPVGDYRVLVRDDDGKAVCGARVSVSGVLPTAETSRSGRAVLRAEFSGDVLLRVDGVNAAATDTDQLGTLTILAATSGERELPFVIYLPDVSDSTGLALNTGTQAGGSVLNDSAAGKSGAILTISAGESVSFESSGTVGIQTGKLSVGHLPTALPGPVSGGRLSGRGVYVHPTGVRFSLGAALSLPNDLGLAAAGSAELYHLDPATGTWTVVGAGTENAGRIEAPAGSVTRGGLYCFSTTVASTSTVSGRVLDLDLAADPVPGVLVRGPQSHTRTDAAGQFTLLPMARLDASGAVRTVAIEFDGGRDYFPLRMSKSVILNSGAEDLGDLALDTRRVSSVRMLMINRGRKNANRRLRISGNDSLTVGTGTVNDQAELFYEDLAIGLVGYLSSEPFNEYTIFQTQGHINLFARDANRDLLAFGREILWRPSQANGTFVRVVDSLAGGPVQNADVVLGSTPGLGFAGKTNLIGVISMSIGSGTQITAVFQSTSDGRSVTSAFTLVGPDSGRLELPVERARRLALGNFQRFGMYSGSLTSSGGASKTRHLRSTGRMVLQDWYDEVFLGMSRTFDVPFRSDPGSSSGTSFLVGVPEGYGHLAAAEGTTAGGVFTLERLGMILGLAPVAGDRFFQALDLSMAASSTYQVNGATTNKHPALAFADLSFDLAGQLDNDLIVDLVRDVGGNVSIGGASGNDATFTLPALPAGLRRYLLAFGGTGTAAGATVEQRTFLPLSGQTSSTVTMLPVATVSSPAAGATVSSAGFTVAFDAPAAANYVVMRLRSEVPTDIRDWTVVLPWNLATSFTFFQPPPEVPTPLIAGRTWNLEIISARIESGLLVDGGLSKAETYGRVHGNWAGIGEAERGVNAFSKISFTLQTN